MNPPRSFAPAVLFALLAALLPASDSHAATYVWNNASIGNWFSSGLTLSSNWIPSGGTLAPADSLVFNFDQGGYVVGIDQNGTAQITNLTVSGGDFQGNFSSSLGSTLTISGSLVNLADADASFSNPVEFVTGAVVDAASYGFEFAAITGSGNFQKLGPNSLYLYNGAVNYSGTMTISQGPVYTSGTFGGSIVNNGGDFSSTGALAGSYVQSSGTGVFAGALSVNQTGGLIEFPTGTNTVGSLAGSGGTINLAAGAALTIGNATSTTYSGSIVGSGSLSKVGAGTLTLTGSNSYSGATTVSAGRLSVNGALGNSPVMVLAAAELGGSGSIGGPVSVANGGTLSPGNSIQSLSTGAATFAAGATFEYEVDSTNPLSLSTAADLLVVSGNLNLDTGNGTILTVADLAGSPNPFVNDTTIFALINYSGAWNGGLFTYGGTVLADGSRFAVGSQQWEIDYNLTSSSGLDNFTGDYLPASSFVAITAVPEPTTYAMAFAGIAYGGFSMWRRRKRA